VRGDTVCNVEVVGRSSWTRIIVASQRKSNRGSRAQRDEVKIMRRNIVRDGS
jgi:hypothetical protein